MHATCSGCKEEELWKSKLWTVMPRPEEDNEDEEEEDFTDVGGGGGGGMMGMSYDLTTQQSSQQIESNQMFYTNIYDMVITGYKESNKPENLLMEIKGFKFAHNKEFSDCINAVIPALIELCAEKNAIGLTQVIIITKIKNILSEKKWGYILLKALVQNQNDEISIIHALEDCCISSTHSMLLLTIFRIILQILYDAEILTEEALLQWITSREIEVKNNSISIEKIKLFQQPSVQEFVEWLQGDEEEEEEEDDEDN